MSELIKKIGRLLYEWQAGASTPLALLYDLLPDDDRLTIGQALYQMRAQGLIDAAFENDPIRLSPAGRDAWNDDSLVELTLGMEYVATRYGPATVHIIVRGPDGEAGGSGFFSQDYPGWIVTAAHVLSGRTIQYI